MTRDMSFAQYKAAAERNGLHPNMLGLAETQDGAGHSSIHTVIYGLCMRKIRGQWKVNHRATLARALASRAKAQKRAADLDR